VDLPRHLRALEAGADSARILLALWRRQQPRHRPGVHRRAQGRIRREPGTAQRQAVRAVHAADRHRDPRVRPAAEPGGDHRPAVLEQGWPLWAGVDFGSWRFAFILAASDRANRLHILEELFSQKETLEARARKIHDILTSYGAARRQDVRLVGDAANPTDILELNEAFKRIGSPFRCGAVEAENKLRAAGVARINNLMSRSALLIRRTIGEYQSWRLGQSAASEGKVVMGSRLLWELTTWRYPEPTEVKGVEQAQKQDPDDNTADGADMMAALRYLVMSWWRKAGYAVPDEKPKPNVDTGLEELLERLEAETAPSAAQKREAAEFQRMVEEGERRAAGRNVDAPRRSRPKKPPRGF
jgi:hypothetical protein